MGILGRLSTLIKSNVNDAIDSMQDPGKEIDQMVRDMEDYARQARAEVARCIADERLLERRLQTIEGEIADWQKKAEMAIRAGDDALAKQALLRKGEKETERTDTKKALQEQGVYGDQLTAALKALEARLKDIKLRQGSLKAKAKANRDGTMTAKTSAFGEFERMSSRIDATEAEAGLDDELAGRTTTRIAAERQLNQMANDSAVDDALAELKRKLGK
ncbi:MAG TPA: PspA/IM30 family protein [Polyangia bacterium]|nr:PspA/IM30 family protein [Polyangia bacterium]